jgi:hypothetical protein
MSGSRPPRRIGRGIVAVLAGFLMLAVLSMATDLGLAALGIAPSLSEPWPDSLLLLATAYRIVYGILGCYVAARLAPDAPMLHALALGVFGVVLSTAGAIAMSGTGPVWYSIAIIAISMPCAWMGGRLYLLRAARTAT